MRFCAERTRGSRTSDASETGTERREVLRRLLLELRRLLVMCPQGRTDPAPRGAENPAWHRYAFTMSGLLARVRWSWGALPSQGPSVFFLDARVDFLAVHLHLGRCLDAELHLTGSNLEHGDLHGITDSNVLS